MLVGCRVESIFDPKGACGQVVLAGCVPSGDKSLPERLPKVSMLHVTQLDRIVDVVEEASKGRVVTLLEKTPGKPLAWMIYYI